MGRDDDNMILLRDDVMCRRRAHECIRRRSNEGPVAVAGFVDKMDKGEDLRYMNSTRRWRGEGE